MVVPNKEADYTNAKTSVWWDLENLDDYENFDANTAKVNICSALVGMKYFGTVSIFCYGDVSRIPEPLQNCLVSSGISITAVVADGKAGRMIADMLNWSIDNPAPANYLLISNDVQFTYCLNCLRMRDYNILLAISPTRVYASLPLIRCVWSVWLCTSLFAGGSPICSSELLQSNQTQYSEAEIEAILEADPDPEADYY